tara:strand:+ start:345 stop:1322 length:978 start_codon:yes stop_codon:yes gene_type:complete
MNRICYCFIIFSCFFFFSCDLQIQSNSTGKSLEVILIKGENCSGGAFEIFQKNFISPQKPILETEIYGEQKNFFRLIPILEKDFNSIFRTHKNIVFVNFGDKFNIQKKKDLWAKNQNVYICSIDSSKISNHNQIINFANVVGEKMKESEIIKRKKNYQRSTNSNIKNYLQKKHNLSISLPSRFFIADSSVSCLNLRGDTKLSSQRILVSSFNLEPTIDNIILEQNRIAKNNISSSNEDSHLVVEKRTSLYIDTLTENNQKKIIIKGLWRMEGDFMGGSFLTTLIVNTKNKKNTLVSLYLYAPGENKANYLLDLEAILKSAQYINS